MRRVERAYGGGAGGACERCGGLDSEEHNARVRALNKAIEDTPRPAQDLSNGVEQLGYGIDEIEQVCGSGDDGLIECTVVGPDKFSFTMAGYFSLGDD